MGFRFNKRIKIAPGVYINLSRRGVSGSVGIPGTGLSYGQRLVDVRSQRQSSQSAQAQPAPQQPPRRSFFSTIKTLVAFLFLFSIFASIAVEMIAKSKGVI